MQPHPTTFKILASLCAFMAWLALTPAPAAAKGTMVVHRFNGNVNTYKEVEIKVLHGALFVTTKDGKGTLVIHRAACSYQEKVLVCFPTSVSLVQGGKTQPLDLKTGTLYFNTTDDAQPLVLSSRKIPPHSMLLSLSTKRGTYASMNGRIDQVVK
jgi:hypothetical protein